MKDWSQPRRSIAAVYSDNDLAYATHGAKVACRILQALDLKPSELRDMTMLDYGCGTGKNIRPLSWYFKSIDGYDPIKECIDTAEFEHHTINEIKLEKFPSSQPLVLNNITYVNDLRKIYNKKYDVVQSFNVLTHLNDDECVSAMANMFNMCADDGVLLIEMNVGKKSSNRKIAEKYKAYEIKVHPSGFREYRK